MREVLARRIRRWEDETRIYFTPLRLSAAEGAIVEISGSKSNRKECDERGENGLSAHNDE